MKTPISKLLFASLFSVAVITDLNIQGTVFSAQGTLKEDLAPHRGAAEPGPLTGDKAIAHLKITGQYDSLSAAITGARYGVKTDPEQEQRGVAANPAHGLLSTFSPEGLRLQIRTGGEAEAPVHTVTWRLESLGYGAAQRSVPAGVLKTEGARVELARTTPRLTEWFQNTPAGLEHGFTLPERPSANPQSELLRLVVAVTGDLAPEADATGQNLSLRDAAGRVVVSYARLKVWDASGTELDATMQTGAGCVILSVNEAAARYPLTIDPTFTQQAYLKASNTGESDYFGASVAVSGDTVVVGAPGEDSNATGVNGDGNNSATNSGAAYVFVRSGNSWSQQAYLKASNTGADDAFGYSVAVSGDTVVVGASIEDGNATGVNGNQSDNNVSESGAAYVFETTAAEIAVEQPLNTNLADGGSQDFVVIGGNNPSLTFTIKNTGNDTLTGLTITTDGPDAAMFTVTANPTAPVAPGGNTTFTVLFAPTSPGAKTAALHLASNDLNESPFDLILQGFTLTFSQDTDGDGINDAPEFQMRDLGFDWKVSQPALVNALSSNANGMGLFTPSQVQALNVGTPLISKDTATGLFKLTIGVQKSTNLIEFNPFPMTAPQTTINAQGKLEFQFSVPDDAAFFRLEAR